MLFLLILASIYYYFYSFRDLKMLSHLLFILTFLSFQENVCPRASNTSNLQGL